MRSIVKRKGLFGTTEYWENGQKVGESRPGLFGRDNIYDADGKKVGYVEDGVFGEKNFVSTDDRINSKHVYTHPAAFYGTDVFTDDGESINVSDSLLDSLE